MRFYWVLLSLLSVLLLSTPVTAARFLFWRFEENQNRLVFTTDGSVQPTAQLISNPTRLVIDLPGVTLGQPTIDRPVGGAITSVRIGQFSDRITRIVIELAPGYTLDPQQVQIRGATPTQWSVELPTPQPIGQGSGQPSTQVSARPRTTPTIQVTGSGLYLRLGDVAPEDIDVERSEDRRSIDINLKGVTLPANLADQSLTVNKYGVGQIQFSQPSTSPPVSRVTLNVNEASPDWWVSASRFGGLVLVPSGDVSSLAVPAEPSTPEIAAEEVATVEDVKLGIGAAQLLIQTDRPVRFRSRRLAGGVHEIVVPNARLARNATERLPSGRSVSQVQVQQRDSRTVVILIRPRVGFEVGDITQRNERLFTVDLREIRATPAPPRPSTRIPVPPPERGTVPPPTNFPRVPSGRILVVIDPGHGGRDPGAIGLNGLREKDVILPISLEVARLLEQQGVSVILTRSNDTFISLEGRTQLANRSRANLFVSIHANAVNRSNVSGVETFYFQTGRGLAAAIQSSIIQSFNVRNRGVKRARFYVLRNSAMPSALVEVGFVTGVEDAPRLADPQYRQQMAVAIARGILNYIQQNRL